MTISKAKVLAAIFGASSFLNACAAARTHSKKISVDIGAEVRPSAGVFPSAGVSVPVGDIYLSTGLWGGTDYDAWYWGPYAAVGYSFEPFAN